MNVLRRLAPACPLRRRHLPASLAGCLWLLLLASPGLQALSPDMRFHQFELSQWSIKQGLPQVTVHALTQGPDNYIWAGTQAGLARFDGTRFELYSPDNHPVLPSRLIRSLYVDASQRLWIGTLRGAAWLQDGSIQRVPTASGKPVDILDMTETSDGWILLATGSGLWRSRGDTLERSPGAPLDSLLTVYHREGKTWVGGQGQIWQQHDGTWIAESLPASLAGVQVTDLVWHEGRLWAGTSRGLLRREGGQWQHLAISEDIDSRRVEALFTDANGTLWVGATGRLYRMQHGRVIDTLGTEGPFADGNVLSMAEDHEGSLWLGSRSYGLVRLWDGYVMRYDSAEGLHAELTWTLARDVDDAIVVGTADGLARYQDGRFQQLVRGEQQPHPHAYSLLPEPERIWVGTRAGLYWWWREDERIERPAAFDALQGEHVQAILRRRDGSYWLGTTSGIWRWDGERLEQRLSASDSSANQTWILLETRDGQLMAGTVGGILLEGEDGTFDPVDGLDEVHEVMALTQLADGRVVAGSRSEQLLISGEDGWRTLGPADGLPGNTVFALVEQQGTLWVAGNRGLYHLPLQQLDAYLRGDSTSLDARMLLSERGDVAGAQNTTCCNGAGSARALVKDGALWFPTREGIIAVHPGQTGSNRYPPRLHIDRVRLDGRWQPASNDTRLQLDKHQRDIAFGFTALSYQDPGSVQLQYRLLGYRDQWQALDDPEHRTAFFTNLPSGTLHFQVRGSNNAGVWSPDQAELTLHIAPYWHETLWAKLAAAATLLLLMWLGVRWRTRNLAQRQRQLRQLVGERTEELRVANENLRQYSRQLETASMTDPLTGLWNRRYLSEKISVELTRFQQEKAAGMHQGNCRLLALLDLDHFKRVNDQLGHDAGDQVLRQFADFLRAMVHPRDEVLRWGGEEFLLVLQPLPEQHLAGLAERLVRSIEQHAFTLEDGRSVALTASLGLCPYPLAAPHAPTGHWELAIELADKGLYTIKHGTRNGWCLVLPRATEAVLREHIDSSLDALQAKGLIDVERAPPEQTDLSET